MPNFRKNAIDGAELQSLNHETLQNALGICKYAILFSCFSLPTFYLSRRPMFVTPHLLFAKRFIPTGTSHVHTLFKTRLHSTDHRLTVSRRGQGESDLMQTPSKGTPPLRGQTPSPQRAHPPIVDRMTDTSENITFPHTLYAVGN